MLAVIFWIAWNLRNNKYHHRKLDYQEILERKETGVIKELQDLLDLVETVENQVRQVLMDQKENLV